MMHEYQQNTTLLPPCAVQGGQQLDAFAKWAFYLFMASLPFKMPLPEGLVGIVSPARIAAVLLVFAFLISPALRPWRLPKTFVLFAAFFVVVLLSTIINGEPSISSLIKTISYIQFLLLFFLAYHFFLNGSATRGALVAYVLSSLVVAGMTFTGFATTIESGYGQERAAAFGEDVNVFATWFIAAALMCYGLGHTRKGPKPWPWFVSWVIAVPFLYVIIHTGSRGGALGLMVGVLTFVAKYGSIKQKIINLFIVMCVATGVVYLFMSDEIFMRRAERTIKTRDTAKREKIWTAAWETVKERPVLGWGTMESRRQLSIILDAKSELASEHSLLFRVLLFGGFVGGILFFSGLFICLWHAYLARVGVEGLLPLALLLSAVTAHMALGGLSDKNLWVFMAYALATGTAVKEKARIERQQSQYLRAGNSNRR